MESSEQRLHATTTEIATSETAELRAFDDDNEPQSARAATALDEDAILRATTRFYESAFADSHLDQFIRSHADPHGQRLAAWLVEHMSNGSVTPWSDERATRTAEVTVQDGRGGYTRVTVHDRTSAHVAAWHSVKRAPEHVGRRFKLDDCRVWMRLFFWAARHEGVLDNEYQQHLLVQVITRFVGVYERSARDYVLESLLWSANPANTQAYIDGGRIMHDVLSPGGG